MLPFNVLMKPSVAYQDWDSISKFHRLRSMCVPDRGSQIARRNQQERPARNQRDGADGPGSREIAVISWGLFGARRLRRFGSTRDLAGAFRKPAGRRIGEQQPRGSCLTEAVDRPGTGCSAIVPPATTVWRRLGVMSPRSGGTRAPHLTSCFSVFPGEGVRRPSRGIPSRCGGHSSGRRRSELRGISRLAPLARDDRKGAPARSR